MKRILLTSLLFATISLTRAQTIYYSLIPDFSTATENSLSVSLTGQEANATDLEFSNDGQKLFVIGTSSDALYEYDLTTAFDITTASYSGNSLSVSAEDTSPQGFVFNQDGTILFVVGNGSGSVHEYTLGTAFSLSTATSSGVNFSVSTQDTSPLGIDFNAEGSKMYILGSTGDAIYEYDLTTNFGISTASYSGSSFSVSSQSTSPSDLELAPDGSFVFVLDQSVNSLISYKMDTVHRIGTASLFSELSLANSTTNSGFAFSRDFRTIAVIDGTSSLTDLEVGSTAFSEAAENNGTLVGSIIATLVGDTFTGPGENLAVTTDYTINNLITGFTPSLLVDSSGVTATLIFSGRTNSDQDTLDVSSVQFTFTDDAFVVSAASAVTGATGPAESNLGIDLNAGFNQPEMVYSIVPDITDATSSGSSISLSNDSGFPDFTFSGDGLKLFMLGTGDSIYQYSLSTAFDISSATDSNLRLFLGDQDTSPVALRFDNSGTRLFVLGSVNDAIYQYELTTSFDISTGTYSGTSLSVATYDSTPVGFSFSGSGDRLYLVGDSGSTVDQLNLSSAFNINSVSSTSSLSLVSTNTYNSIEFSANGRSLYLGTTSSIIQYDMTTAFDVSGATSVGTLTLTTTSGNNAAFRFNPGLTRMVTLNTSLTLDEYSIAAVAFEETEDNDGQVAGLLVARIERGFFSSSLTADDVTIAGIPSGFTASVALGDDQKNIGVSLSGQTVSNDLGNSVSDIQISFSDDAFEDLTASDVSNSTDTQTGLGISFTSGSNIPRPTITYSKLPNIANVSDTVTRSLSIADLQGLVFNDDGSRLYMLNATSVNEYFLSTNYDISTASLNHQFSISTQESGARGLAFNNIGTRLFVIGATMEINVFRLTLAYDLSTASFDSVINTITDDSSPTDLAFSDDGTKMYILGDTNDSLFEYELSTAFDPSTASLSTSLALGTSLTGPQGISFSPDGSSFFLVDNVQTRFYQFDLSTPFDVSTGSAKLINVSISSELTSPSSIQLAGDGETLLISGTTSDKICQYSFPVAGFIESAANDGMLEGRIIGRLIGDTFNNAGGTFTQGNELQISDIPFGIDPVINISTSGQVLTVDYNANALNNDTTNNVENIVITYQDEAFTNSDASEIIKSTGSDSTGRGISYMAGSELVLDVELSTNNDVVTDLGLDGNTITVFSWKTKAGTEETVIDTVTVNSSYIFGSILTDFSLAVSANADGSNLTQLSPANITITDSLVSFQDISDTLDIIEEAYYFVFATTSGVTTATDTINFALVSTNLKVTGPNVASGTVNGSDIAFTNLAFTGIQDGIIDSIAYGETKVLDVDNDDDLDIIAAGIDGTGASVLKYYTNAAGEFATGVDFGTAKDTVRLIQGDFDNDFQSEIDLLVQGFVTDNNGATLYTNSDLDNATEFDTDGGNLVNGDIAAGDLDGDGDLDIIMTGHEDTNSSNLHARIFRNDGSNSYTLIDTLNISAVVNGDIEVGDVDNDGDLDVFITGMNSSGNPVAELHIRGASGFALSSSAFTAVSKSAADFGDYDGDGYLDLIVSGQSNSTGPVLSTTIYTNGGDGSFTASSISITDSFDGDVKWIDLDNDGDKDLVQTGVTGAGTSASVWINDGTTLTEAYVGNIAGLSRGNISYGDFDGDDDLDLVLNGLTGASEFVTQIYENALYSGFVSEVSTPDSIGIIIEDTRFQIGWDSSAGVEYEVIVVKTDSLQNVEVLRSADSKRLNGYVRNPERPRLRNTTYEINDVERAAYRIGVQRVNSISKGSEFRRIESFFNGTPYAPVAISASDLTSNSFTANWAAQAAIDSFAVTLVREETINGTDTLISEGTFATNSNSYEFLNLRRNRNYRYTVQAFNDTLASAISNEIRVILPLSSLFIATNISGFAEDAYESLVLGDFDNDDKLDIVASTGSSSFLLLNGSSSTIDLQAARTTSSVEVFDFGNDGDLDVFMTGTANSAGVTSFFQNSETTFTETVTNSSQFLQAKITSGDVDNDGDVDVVLMGLATSSSVKTEVLINNGTNYDSLAQDFIGDTQGDLGLTDFDLDGDLDLLVIGTTEASLYINQSGTFATGSTRTFDLLSDVDLKLADMTGDGRPDVVYSGATEGSSFLKIYSANDTLGFVKITDLDITSLSSSAPKIELIDGDNDGTLDVFLVGTESMEVYSNTANGVITESEALTINIDGLSNAATAFGDYDKDGDVDLVFSGVNSSNADDAGLLSNANDTGNDVPSAPTNLEITFPEGNWVLQWDPSSDAETSTQQLNYNVTIQNDTETLTYQSANQENGFRKVSGYGNIQDTAWVFNPINLPVGEYSWKVQAIDANGQGSAFSAESPLAVPDTVKIFNNQPAIASGEIDGGASNVVFFSFGINATDNSTLDSLAFNLNGDFREYMIESTFKLFRSVDSNPDLSPEDQIVEAVSSSDGSTISVSGLNISLSQQQVYFFLVAQAKFVAEEGEFSVTLNSSNITVQESGFVGESNSLTGNNISIRNAVTIYTPGTVPSTDFQASSENAEILVFKTSSNVAGVNLEGLDISASSTITDKFENVRVFSSTDNSLDVQSDTELGTFVVDGNAMSSDFTSTSPGSNTEQFYFVIADIPDGVSQSTETISLTLNSPEDLRFSSTEIDTVEFTTADYSFYFDLIPPDVRYDDFDENVTQGSGPHTVSFTVQDQFEITAVDFFWRQLSSSSFTRVSQTVNSTGSYSHEFGADDIGSVGVEFYASATDLDGNINNPDLRSIGILFNSSDPIDIRSEASIKLGGQAVTDYSLISFPFQSGRFSDVLSGLENAKHGGLAEVFGGDDNTKWRLISLRSGSTDASGFQDLTLSSTFSPGAGYYLIVGVKDVDIQVVSARTIEASSDNPHTVALSTGWNMIGNPYLFPISIESIRDYNLAVGNITDGSVINDFRLFKNGQFVSDPSEMERFDGAFIRVTENVSNFAFPMNNEIPSNSGGRVALTRWDEVIEEDSWRLNLTISQGNQLSLGGFGIKEDATSDVDNYDQYVLPAPGNYIRLQHEIDGELSVIRNSIKEPDLVNVWNTSLHAVRDGVMTIEWDQESISNLSRAAYLFDPVGLRFIDMKSASRTSVSVSKGSNELLFYYGPADLKEEVIADHVVAVGQVYPNPVSDQIGVNIIGQVNTEISLKLYDLFGKEMLSTEEVIDFPGINTVDVVLDSRLQSGLYFLEVQLSNDKGVYRSKQKILINE